MNILMVTMLFYILKRNYLNKSCIFSDALLLYKISKPSIKWF